MNTILAGHAGQTPLHSVLNIDQWRELDAAIFDNSKMLESIRAHARHVRVAPIALLFVSIVRVLGAVPPTVHLNAGGGPGALNTFVALIGPSGAGKDRTLNAATRALRVLDADGREIAPPTFPLGSGEGVTGVYAPREGHDGPIPGETTALFVETEVSSLTALMGRTGATLRSTLLKVYSGGDLGATNKSEHVSVPWGTYRAGMIVGAQPDRVGGILDDAGDGLPQRFAWTELVDPLRKEGRAYPTADVLPVPLPAFDGQITYCDQVVAATRAADDARLITGNTGGLNAHGHLTRLKIAAGIAVLRGRAHVTEDDWRRAGAMCRYSDKVRHRCTAHLEGQRVAAEAEKHRRHEAAEAAATADRISAVTEKVYTALESADDVGGWVNERLIRRGLTKRQQDVLPDVLDSLRDGDDDGNGAIESQTNPDPRARGGLQWRLCRD